MGEARIKRIQVYGMRCSGTNYLDGLISKNFLGVQQSSTDPEILRTFGWKHGDVGTKVHALIKNKLKEVQLMPLDWARSRDTLLLVVYRSPFTWLQSLHRTPHHSPESYGVDFSSFIRQPWRAFYCEPGEEDSPDPKIRARNMTESRLIEHFPSVFGMRQNRIRVFESFKYRFRHVVYLNYESLVQAPEAHLRDIAKRYGIRMRKKFQDVTTYKAGTAPYAGSSYESVSNEDLAYILDHTSWLEEKVIGYRPKLSAGLRTYNEKATREPNVLLRLSPSHRYYINAELPRSQRLSI